PPPPRFLIFISLVSDAPVPPPSGGTCVALLRSPGCRNSTREGLYAPSSPRPATVMRQGRDILDRQDAHAGRLYSGYSGFAPAAGAFHPHLDFVEAEAPRRLRRRFT